MMPAPKRRSDADQTTQSGSVFKVVKAHPSESCRAVVLALAGWLLAAGDGLGQAQDSPALPEAGRGQAAALAETGSRSAVRFDPVVRDIEGWKVHIEPALLDGEHREEGARALAMLANHLQRITILVPAGPLAKLQQAEIWIEHSHPTLRPMQYHPSRQWLMANGHDPRLTGKVHITQARELLSRAEMLKHPAVILHELAHAYHDQVLGFDHPEIVAAYEQARAAGIYDRVLAHTGERVRHYGLTSPMEYFAEGTEAFFYRNDFHPFVRAELKEHDPALHELLVRIWEPTE